MTVVLVAGPVIVNDEPDTFATDNSAVVADDCAAKVQTNDDDEVKAGEIPEMVTVLGVPLTRGALP